MKYYWLRKVQKKKKKKIIFRGIHKDIENFRKSIDGERTLYSIGLFGAIIEFGERKVPRGDNSLNFVCFFSIFLFV